VGLVMVGLENLGEGLPAATAGSGCVLQELFYTKVLVYSYQEGSGPPQESCCAPDATGGWPRGSAKWVGEGG